MVVEEFECSLTGLMAEGSESSDADGLGSLPVGWTKIEISRRRYNPDWVEIQEVKEQTVQNLLAQIPAELREANEMSVQIQIDAQFAALEQSVPMYIMDISETVYISDSPEITGAMNQLRTTLGLAHLPPEEEDDEADADDEEEED